DHGGAMLMVAVTPIKDGLAIYQSRTAGIARFDIVKTINGQDALDLFARAKALEPGEPALQRFYAGHHFPSLLWDLGLRPPYIMEGTFANQSRRIELPGSTKREIDASNPPGGLLSYRMLPNAIGLLELRGMTDSPGAFAAKLDWYFEQISHDRP